MRIIQNRVDVIEYERPAKAVAVSHDAAEHRQNQRRPRHAGRFAVIVDSAIVGSSHRDRTPPSSRTRNWSSIGYICSACPPIPPARFRTVCTRMSAQICAYSLAGLAGNWIVPGMREGPRSIGDHPLRLGPRPTRKYRDRQGSRGWSWVFLGPTAGWGYPRRSGWAFSHPGFMTTGFSS